MSEGIFCNTCGESFASRNKLFKHVDRCLKLSNDADAAGVKDERGNRWCR